MKDSINKPISIRTHFIILLGLIVAVLVSASFVSGTIHEYSVAGALIFAAIQIFLVLHFYVQPKMDKAIYKTVFGLLALVFITILLIGIIDYMGR